MSLFDPAAWVGGFVEFFYGDCAPNLERPEFGAVAVDAVRKLSLLQSTKAFWEKTGHTFKQDMRMLANTTDKDFQDFQLNLQNAALRNMSITELIGQARAQGATAVQKTLQHVLMHTANAPMTEGNKVIIRQMGQTMNERFGPFSSFFTTCLLYTSPSPRDQRGSRMPSSA